VAAIAGGGPAMATTSAAPASDSPQCTSGHVPRSVRFAPARLIATRKGDAWLWYRNGWHLRVRHKGSAHVVFTGHITVADQTMSFKPFRLEANDSVTLAGDAKTLDFTFNNYGHLDGLDIDAHCASQITFDFTFQGAPMNPDRVHLGTRQLPALTMPVVISRR
jgi:hypothetical protein